MDNDDLTHYQSMASLISSVTHRNVTYSTVTEERKASAGHGGMRTYNVDIPTFTVDVENEEDAKLYIERFNAAVDARIPESSSKLKAHHVVGEDGHHSVVFEENTSATQAYILDNSWLGRMGNINSDILASLANTFGQAQGAGTDVSANTANANEVTPTKKPSEQKNDELKITLANALGVKPDAIDVAGAGDDPIFSIKSKDANAAKALNVALSSNTPADVNTTEQGDKVNLSRSSVLAALDDKGALVGDDDRISTIFKSIKTNVDPVLLADASGQAASAQNTDSAKIQDALKVAFGDANVEFDKSSGSPVYVLKTNDPTTKNTRSNELLKAGGVDPSVMSSKIDGNRVVLTGTALNDPDQIKAVGLRINLALYNEALKNQKPQQNPLTQPQIDAYVKHVRPEDMESSIERLRLGTAHLSNLSTAPGNEKKKELVMLSNSALMSHIILAGQGKNQAVGRADFSSEFSQLSNVIEGVASMSPDALSKAVLDHAKIMATGAEKDGVLLQSGLPQALVAQLQKGLGV